MKSRLWIALAIALIVVIPAFAQEEPPEGAEPTEEAAAPPEPLPPLEGFTQTESGLQYKDLKEGTGEPPEEGQTCWVHYTGWLYENGEQGEKFDQSFGRGPLQFKLGAGSVIKGWDEGIATMKKGGRRVLIVPPDLAYGEAGFENRIPPNATLMFHVDLMLIKSE